jgi:hypothetical protein
MNTRPPEPQFLLDYRQWLQSGPPKCCFTCDSYTNDGVCEKHQMRPPDEFAGSVDACDKWEFACPF